MSFSTDQTRNEAHSTLLARSRRQHGCDSTRSKSIAAPVNLSTIDRSPPPRTLRVPRSSRHPERRPEGDWPLTHASTTSTRFPNDEVRSSGKSLEFNARPYRKGGHFVSSLLGVIDRLKAAAIEFASIGILISGFIIAALCAVDLMDMW